MRKHYLFILICGLWVGLAACNTSETQHKGLEGANGDPEKIESGEEARENAGDEPNESGKEAARNYGDQKR